MIDIEMPVFLRAAPGSLSKPRPIRWKRMKAKRPEGEKWSDAERWEITIGALLGGKTGTGLAPGTRYVWVREGTKWAEIRDSEDYAKVPLAMWRLLQRNGRQVS